MLTPEELLKDRYKVFAQYPHSGFNLGEIISVDSLALPRTGVELFNAYPHLFKKLHWWEYRKREDMPEYVRWSPSESINQFTSFHKVGEWFSNNEMFSTADGENPFETSDDYFPATEAEYLNQQTIKK